MSNHREQDAKKLTNGHKGLDLGYSGNISFGTHNDFYDELCILYSTIPEEFERTKRGRLIWMPSTIDALTTLNDKPNSVQSNEPLVASGEARFPSSSPPTISTNTDSKVLI